MPLTEQEINDAFGLGANEQGTDAGPAPDNDTQETGETSTTSDDSGAAGDTYADTDDFSENDQDVPADEPAGADDSISKDSKESDDASGEGTAGSGQADDGPDDGFQGQKPDSELSPEERRANAARRREREQQEAIDKAVKEAVEGRVAEILGAERAQMESEWSSFFQKARLENPVTGLPIKTKAEFDAWEQEEAAAQMQRDLAEGNLTPELLNKVIAENPIIKRTEELERQRAREAMDARVSSELTEIAKLDPSVKTLEDITKLPTGPAFIQLVRDNGYSFLDAFKIANFDRLTSARAARDSAAAKQQAIQNAKSKNHLTETGKSRGEGSKLVPVPDAVKRTYREYNPGMTDEEIQKDYTKRMA